MDPDLTPVFSDFKDAKKKKSNFFLLIYPQAHYLQSQKLTVCENFELKFYFASIILVFPTPL
jgi:hypothetical protein